MGRSKRMREESFVPSTQLGETPVDRIRADPPKKKARTLKVDSLAQSPTTSKAATSYQETPNGIALVGPPVMGMPIDSSHSKRTGKARKKTDPDTPIPEKRGAKFKASCPQNIMARVERVMSQRFFMIDRQRTPHGLEEVFSVLGSTGNVYTVTINHKPSCNCPDAIKGNHCKHILFIFLKVLQVPQSSGSWYQKALLTSELETIFDNAPLAPNALANSRVREAHARALGKVAGPNEEQATSSKKRLPGPDDDCPICYETMHGVNENSLAFCDECGNALHKECFQQWQASSMRDAKTLTCVWCRAKWIAPTAAGMSRDVSTSEGYLNLGNISGASPVRDTSTYYQGRGRRYHYGYGYRQYGCDF